MTNSTTTITVGSFHVDGFENLIEKFNKKAKKIGSPTVDILSEEDVAVKNYLGEVYEGVKYEINTPVIRLGDYEIVAMYTIENGAELKFKFDGYESDVKEVDYRRCDHCNVRHERKTVLVVSDGEKEMQVGKSCVKDFTGISVSTFDWLRQTVTAIHDYDDDGSEGSSGEILYSVENVLALAHMSCKERGYHKAGSEMPTSSVVSMMLSDGVSAEKVNYDWAESAVEIIKGIESDNDYVNNVKNMVNAGYISMKRVGLIASAFTLVENEKQKKITRNTSNSEYVGEIKERITFEGTIKFATVIEGFYGVSTLYIIEDNEGNTFKWFCTSEKHFGYEADETYTFTGTVSKHEEYKGVKQTQLKRCKVA